MKDFNYNFYDLNALVSTYNIDNIYEQYKRIEFLEKLGRYVNLKNSEVLEFGSATGQMTEILSKLARKIVAVDGSSDFIEIAQKRVGNSNNVVFHKSYFENLELEEKYDCLIMHHILEHVQNPLSTLSHIKTFLSGDGVIAISVPNAHALSRQLAVKMGLLSSIYELTDNDRHHGHYRVYDWKMLEAQILDSGFDIIGKHGLSFKLFSDKQNIEILTQKIIGEEQIKGLWQLGDELLGLAGAIMIVAKIKEERL